MENDYAQKMHRCHEYVKALEEEQKKIQVFQRELPLCLELVTQAIEACRKELSSTSTTSEQCSEQTTSVSGGPVLEEFIPTKKMEEDGDHDSPTHEEIRSNVDKKKSDWLRSVQLWNPSPDPTTNEVSNPERAVGRKAKVVEVKPHSNCGAFQPFQREKKREPYLLPTMEAVASAPAVKVVAPAPATTTSSTTETCGAEKGRVEHIHQQQSQLQTRRKQRRCWSPELHRRFLHALQQLGGSHVATPKQIRDHMKVDGLTNDEVKSHLQKYRLHTRRPATVTAQGNGNSQQPQFVVVGGIWVPSPQDVPPPSDVANNGGGIYAPVTLQPPPPLPPQSPKGSVERSSGRCNSPSASSSTNTTTSPVS